MSTDDQLARGPGSNTGHGHVWERPDGWKVRCGGPDFCSTCAADKHREEGIAALRDAQSVSNRKGDV